LQTNLHVKAIFRKLPFSLNNKSFRANLAKYILQFYQEINSCVFLFFTIWNKYWYCGKTEPSKTNSECVSKLVNTKIWQMPCVQFQITLSNNHSIVPILHKMKEAKLYV